MDGCSSPASQARIRSSFTPILFAMASWLRLAASLAQTNNLGFAKPSTCAIVGQRVTVISAIVKTTNVTETLITIAILMPPHREGKHWFSQLRQALLSRAFACSRFAAEAILSWSSERHG